MPTITSNQDSVARCQEMIDTCADVIKQLQGDIPQGCTLSFAMNGHSLVKFDITDTEASFAVGFFMSWHQHYTRKLRELLLHQRVDKQA